MPAVLVLMIIVIVVVLALSYYARDARIKRMINRAPETTTADFDERQMGKLFGTLREVADPLQAPLTGRPCAYYEVIVEQYRSSGKSGSWRTIITEREGRDFVFEDSAGTALIKMGLAEVAVVQDRHFRSGTFNDATPELETFLARHGKSSEGWVFNKKLR
ncbi:MAG: hypothetical protein AAGC55_13990, partial [Myxococcota bacterium]